MNGEIPIEDLTPHQLEMIQKIAEHFGLKKLDVVSPEEHEFAVHAMQVDYLSLMESYDFQEFLHVNQHHKLLDSRQIEAKE